MPRKNNKPIEETLDNLEIEQTETIVEELPEEVQPEPLYTINNCKKLNVRKKPSKDSAIVCVVTSANTLKIEEIESKPEWVKVVTDSGLKGFCMKQYVAIK